MKQNEENAASGGAANYRWWAAASTGQLLWGIYSYRRGYSGECKMMPLKAFAVASLFVGATASASMASLRACGIYSVNSLFSLPLNTLKNLSFLISIFLEFTWLKQTDFILPIGHLIIGKDPFFLS
ncbi:putative Import inner membrane translocase subunit tim21, mitochondrial precursor [Capsicum annuum]|nr:putative Import inner membrane translocase subunit tim21, mitochondrial precursor [Capsicum annuum]